MYLALHYISHIKGLEPMRFVAMAPLFDGRGRFVQTGRAQLAVLGSELAPALPLYRSFEVRRGSANSRTYLCPHHDQRM